MSSYNESSREETSSSHYAGGGAASGGADNNHPPISAAAFQLVASFLSFRDRLRLVLTCQSARDGLEEYSKNALAKIQSTHGVDATFGARLHNNETQAHAAVPPLTCFRYLLWKALRTHLYKIVGNNDRAGGGGDFDGDDPRPCSLLCLSKDRMAILNLEGRVEIWNVKTKQRLQTLDQRNLAAPRLYLVDDRLVSCCFGRICVWAENNESSEFNHTFTTDRTHRMVAWVPYGHQLLFMSASTNINDLFYCYSIQVRNGTVGAHFTVNALRRSSVVDMLVCNRKWLVLHIHSQPHRNIVSTIHVYDLDTFRRQPVFQPNVGYGHIFQTSIESKTICVTFLPQPSYVAAHQLDATGRFSESRIHFSLHPATLSVDWDRGVATEMTAWGMSAFQSRLAAFTLDRKLILFNVETGAIERSWGLPDDVDYSAQAVFSVQRNELLIKHNKEFVVTAYLLEEPVL